MFKIEAFEILKKNIDTNGSINMMVDGISMYPTLKKGDHVLVVCSQTYNDGEIIVYNFEDRGILVHRILRLDGASFFCKGDNAYRLEQISQKDIIGKVIAVNGIAIQRWPSWKTKLSYEVNRIYYTSNFNVQYTNSSDTYKLFEILILKKEQDFRVEFINNIYPTKLFGCITKDLQMNKMYNKIYFEVIKLAKCNVCYSEIVFTISSKFFIGEIRAKEFVNCILSKLVINHLISIQI